MYLPISSDKRPFCDLSLGVGPLTSQKQSLGETSSLSMRLARKRLIVVGIFFCVFFLLIGLRLVEIMGLSPEAAGNVKVIEPSYRASMRRSDIVDRNGILLATSLKTASLYAKPFLIKDPEGLAQKIAEILPHLAYADILKKLHSSKKFVWISRNLSPHDQAKIHRLGAPGLDFHHEEKRIYPHGSLLAHVLGFTDVDSQGIGGVEYQFNDFLSKEGSLQLSIDLRVQHILHDELEKTIDKFQAQGGTGVILNVNTGEILAMASFPDFDPNLPKQGDQNNHFNKSTLGVYEMGSAFKIFTTAMALEYGTATLSSRYDASEPLKVARFKIRDYKGKNRVLTVPEIMQYSSNIGAAKMALEIGVDRQKKFMDKLGFLKPASVQLPEVGRPLIPQNWREINLMTISYGYGLSVSPLQLVGGISAMINGGILREPTLLKKMAQDMPQGERIISEKTSLDIRKLLRLIATQGTAKKANVEGFMVGGKTSTAEVQLVGRKGYNRKENLSTCIAAFPITKPEYLIIFMVDRPIATADTYGHSVAGWTAAPGVGNIIKRMGALLGMPLINEKDPQIQQEFFLPGMKEEERSSYSQQGFKNARY